MNDINKEEAERLERNAKDMLSMINKHERLKEISDDVLANSPVYKRIRRQINKGIVKYGNPVTPDEYSIFGWFNHTQEELTDAVTYNEIMLMKLQEVIKSVEEIHNHTQDEFIKMHTTYVLAVLKEGNNNE